MNAVHVAAAAPPDDDPGLIFSMFGGPGGWCVGAEMLGLPAPVGVELDASACATRAAASLPTIRYDVTGFPIDLFAGLVWGLIASPVCVFFSAAGTRAGSVITAELAAAIGDAFAGRPWSGRIRAMTSALRAAGWPLKPARQPDAGQWQAKRQAPFKRRLLARQGKPQARARAITAARPSAQLTKAQQSARIREAVRSAALVVEPARWITATMPEWVALEQVPEVLPLWRVYAAELERLGYHVWCGILNAADYGVPQARRRAVLIASRVRAVSAPVPTHYDPRHGAALFGHLEPWVPMAAVLGGGMTHRPAPTATAGGTKAGGAEVFGIAARDILAAEYAAGRWQVAADGRWQSPAERITPAEVGQLQSFPAGYPWQGTKTQQHTQAGNAVPPLLALRVVAEAAGADWRAAVTPLELAAAS